MSRPTDAVRRDGERLGEQLRPPSATGSNETNSPLRFVPVCALSAVAAPAGAFARIGSEAARSEPPTLSDAAPLQERPARRGRSAQVGAPASKHHDGQVDHLPGVKKNVELVGELNLISPWTGKPVRQARSSRSRSTRATVRQLVE